MEASKTLAEQQKKHDAFLAGRITGEEALAMPEEGLALRHFQDKADVLGEATGHDQSLLTEFNDGYQFTLRNHQQLGYTPVPDIGRIRAMKLMLGESDKEPEAQLMLRPTTVNKLHSILDKGEGLDTDAVLSIGLDLFCLLYEQETGVEIIPGLQQAEVSRRFLAALKSD